MLSTYVLILIFATTASCFNIDTESPWVFVDPASKNNKNARTYFGYSIVMNPRTDTNPVAWIRIGAPKADFHVEKDGLVYNCDREKGCKVMQVPKLSQLGERFANGSIGGTMDISYEFNMMTMCAYRRYFNYAGDHRTFGACYYSTLNSTKFEVMKPLLDPEKSVTSIETTAFYLYGQGQAGFSAHFSNHSGNYVDLVLGAPGVNNWAGTPFRFKFEMINTPPANRRRSTYDISKTVDIPNNNYPIFNEYFGYSVTSGYFHRENELLYAAGAPRGNSYMGKVVIFDFDSSRQIIVKSKIKGTQFGEYFGATIASGKINKDNLDDLVVGAPFFAGKTYNEGKVYVFLSGKGGLKQHMELTGRSKNSQFGLSIMCLGDIDFDGYGDIAVGAPYEDDNTGAIYIYGGSDTGVDKIPRQVIFGKQITSEMLGFGITISKPIDMDENHYKDLAVGAHLSGKAVLLRSRPIVVINYDLFAVPRTLKLDSTSFLLNACFSYSIFNDKTVDITYNISLAGRAKMNESYVNRNLTIHEGNQTCVTTNVTLETSNTPNSPIKVLSSYRLNYRDTSKGLVLISDNVLEGNDTLCIRCPVLDENHSSKIYSELDVPFTQDCGDDNICQSNLSITVKIPGLRKDEPFILGSKKSLEVEVTLENNGEEAYATELQIILPEVTFRQKPARCTDIFTNGSAIKCSIGYPLRKDAAKILDLDLNLEMNLFKLSSAEELQILFKIVTTSENKNNFVRFGLKLKREADIKLFGNSDQQSNFFGNISSIGTSEVIHTYKIQKSGVSPLEKITVEIGIPYSYVYSGKEMTFIELYRPIAILGSQPITCQSEFTYITIKQLQMEDNNVLGNLGVREKRQVEVFKNVTSRKGDIKINDKEIDLIPNKTLFLNYTSEGVNWRSIVCGFDMLEESLATIKIGMVFNVSLFSDTMENKDIILFSTHGTVITNNLAGTEKNIKRSIDVSTAFVNDIIKKKKIALWIMILSAIAGILLLALLIFVLVKARFFHRSKREELKNMKAMAAAQEEEAANNAAEGIQEEELSNPFESNITSSQDIICN